MLAGLQAGGCYVPLDPSFPADRLSIYLEDSQSLALITEPKNQGLADTLIAELPHRPYVSSLGQGALGPQCCSLLDAVAVYAVYTPTCIEPVGCMLLQPH